MLRCHGDDFDIERIGGSDALQALEAIMSSKRGRSRLKHFRPQGRRAPSQKPDRSPVTGCRPRSRSMRFAITCCDAHPDAEFFWERKPVRHGDNRRTSVSSSIPSTVLAPSCEGIPTWSVLCGLEADGEPVVGIAYMPAAGDLFVGVRGGGATHNGQSRPRLQRGVAARRHVMHGSLQQFTD